MTSKRKSKKKKKEWYEPSAFGKACSAVVALLFFAAMFYVCYRLMSARVCRVFAAGLVAGFMSALVYGVCTEISVERQFRDFLEGKDSK